ncbi:MAG: MucB/RseB C-terminal domain-containing protein [Acidiferrobacterales bacterium]
MIPGQYRLLLLALLVWPASALAAESAMDWLMKMNVAVTSKNYDGIFVYRHGDQLEAMRIVHRANNGEHRERLVSLNGEAREVIRNDSNVICYLPTKKSVMVEHRKSSGKNFPSILPHSLDQLASYYSLGLGKGDRVANRETQLVYIKPKDAYRYGYQLWADRNTGLLLRANLINEKGQVVEQFMFTSINIGKKIRSIDLNPGYSGTKWAWYREKKGTESAGNKDVNWNASQLPKGFSLSRRILRNSPMGNTPVEHLVYSDGLAAISVFIEPRDKKGKRKMKGATGMGAVHAFGTVVNNFQITVVGEVPAAAVAMIGNSITYR